MVGIKKLLNRNYNVRVTCDNCRKPCEVAIKKGTTVTEAININSIRCDNCSCLIEPTDYETEWSLMEKGKWPKKK